MNLTTDSEHRAAPAICGTARHDRIKADPREFRERATFLGFQDDGAGGRLELRTCNACGSTLARPINFNDEENR